MLKPALMIIVLVVALAGYAAFAKRAQWIEGKIAALTAPASTEFAAANAALPPKASKPRIVLIGDSRIAQWPAGELPGRFEVINRGIGGETAAQLVKRFDADALALDPDLIVVQAGMNDLVAASLMDTEQGDAVRVLTREALVTMAKRAHAAGRPILLTTVIPPARPDFIRRPVWSASLPDLAADVNADLKKVRLPEELRVIDLSADLTARDGTMLNDDYRRDTLHLNEVGYKRLTQNLLPHVETALKGRAAK